jgi:hypothetical protein
MKITGTQQVNVCCCLERRHLLLVLYYPLLNHYHHYEVVEVECHELILEGDQCLLELSLHQY